jgi:hypothetical protein
LHIVQSGNKVRTIHDASCNDYVYGCGLKRDHTFYSRHAETNHEQLEVKSGLGANSEFYLLFCHLVWACFCGGQGIGLPLPGTPLFEAVISMGVLDEF